MLLGKVHVAPTTASTELYWQVPGMGSNFEARILQGQGQSQENSLRDLGQG